MRKLITILLLTLCCTVQAQNLIPTPKHIVWGKGTASPLTPIREKASPLTPLQRERGTKAGGEAYRLLVTKDSIVITASDSLGFLRARQTLTQLKTAKGYRCCEIEDEPAFSWRGAMIDVSRHFFPLSVLKKQVDALARYKINVLHLHLTDGGGWRLQIDRYPELTRRAAWRTKSGWRGWWDSGTDRRFTLQSDSAYGGFYTKEEMRSLISYCAERGITVVPEIEMPGHANEVMAAYPELQCRTDRFNMDAPPTSDLCLGNEATVTFLENVLDEVMDLFPSRYIHIGGDEAGMDFWKKCPLCQRRLKDLGSTDVHDLQAWFINRIDRYVQQHGRKMIAWDEVLTDSLRSSATVMVWRDLKAVHQAIEKGCDVVLTPSAYYYLDYYQDAPPTQPTAIGGFQPFDRVYSYAPMSELSADELKHVRGVQGNLWTEFVETPSHLEYMLWPRILAVAETGWAGTGRATAADFRKKAEAETARLRQEGYNAFNLSREVGARQESRQPVKHLALGARVDYRAPYSPYYKANGEQTLTDGLRGNWQHGDGRWQGFSRREGLDVVVDLGAVKSIREVGLTFMQSDGAWIYLPETFRIEASQDGQAYTLLYNKQHTLEHADRTIYVPWQWRGRTRARYLHIHATPAPGQWVFTDEIIVK